MLQELSIQETTFLVDSAQGGDRNALETLFERYYPRVRQMVSLRLGHRLAEIEEVDDLAHEALLDAFRRLESFEHRSIGSFRDWLATVVVNRIRDQARRHGASKRDASRSQPVSSVDSWILASAVFPGRANDPPLLAQVQELREAIESALFRLNDRQRRVFELRRIAELSYEEIASIMGFGAPSSARSAFARALQEVMRSMEPYLQS